MANSAECRASRHAGLTAAMVSRTALSNTFIPPEPISECTSWCIGTWRAEAVRGPQRRGFDVEVAARREPAQSREACLQCTRHVSVPSEKVRCHHVRSVCNRHSVLHGGRNVPVQGRLERPPRRLRSSTRDTVSAQAEQKPTPSLSLTESASRPQHSRVPSRAVLSPHAPSGQ